MRRRLVVVVQIGLFVSLLGLPDGGLGVMWPSLRHTFHRPVGDLGILVLAGTVPYLLASTTTGRIVRRTGFGTLTVIIGGVAVVALVAWAVAPVWGVAIGGFALLGWSRGGTDAGLNAYASGSASASEGVRRLGLLHAMYGVGATAGPLLVSVVLVFGGGWRAVVGVLAATAGLVTVAALAARNEWGPAVASRSASPDPKPEGGGAAGVGAAGVGAAGVGAGRRSGRGRVGGVVGMFGLYAAAEAATGAWAFTLLTESRHVDRGIAGAAVAAYWGGLTAGRFAVAAVGHRVGRGRTVCGGAAVALAGVVMLAVGGRVLGPLGLPVAGLGFAPMFPVMVSLIPDHVARKGAGHAPTRRGTPQGTASATVIGWAVGVAAIGGPAGTALAGLIADRATLAEVSAVLVVYTAVLLAAGVVLFWGDT